MPITSSITALGKISGPLVSELEVSLFGMGSVFYVYLIITFSLLIVLIAKSKHMRAIDHSPLLQEAEYHSEVDTEILQTLSSSSFTAGGSYTEKY